MITFDAAVHWYTEDGVVLPSVTQILKIAGKINLSWRTSARAAFGREVHEATAAFDRGEKVISDFYLPVAFYVVGWWIWRETAEAKILEVERVVGGRELGFAGTCDRVVTIDGER